ncbi:MAG: 4-hydroxy-tetrahydrodipicolinate synthase, partial [Clostridia bacterium]|nr:4-hydroxy-tetrahydrodipicolinate synthase [Clostridia bacterium]
MKKTIFRGAGVALVTPMHDDGSVNYEKLKKLVDLQIEGGTDAIIVCGTTGESSTLDEKEHLETIRVVIDHTNGRIPVIAGTGSNDTAFAITLSRDAANLGADGILSVTPYYNKTSQAGLIAHFTAIADAVDCPMILYNVPSRTGTAFQTATYAALAKHPNIVGIKEANANLSLMARTMAACGDDLEIYSGNDDEVVPCLSLGGAGV